METIRLLLPARGPPGFSRFVTKHYEGRSQHTSPPLKYICVTDTDVMRLPDVRDRSAHRPRNLNRARLLVLVHAACPPASSKAATKSSKEDDNTDDCGIKKKRLCQPALAAAFVTLRNDECDALPVSRRHGKSQVYSLRP